MAFPGFSSYVTQLRKISVFDEDTYKKATDNENGPFKILITPKSARVGSKKPDVAVKGVIQSPVNFTMAANWDVLGLENIFSSLISQNGILKAAAGAVKSVMGAAGSSLTNSGLVTKKFYTKSDYLTFDVKFRVLDWNDDGMPVKTAQVMLGLCVPRKGPTVQLGSVLNKIGTENSPYRKIKENISEGVQKMKNSDNEVIAATGGMLSRGSGEIVGGEVNVTQAPSPVKVQIGHWFQADDCVITNVSTEFAEQMTIAGPSYADFTVSISTRETVTVGKNGIDGLRMGRRGANRVKIDTGSTINTLNV